MSEPDASSEHGTGAGGRSSSSSGGAAHGGGAGKAGAGGGSVCGNGKVEAGEQCDDGNLLDNDSCTSLCTDNTSCLSCLAKHCAALAAGCSVLAEPSQKTACDSVLNCIVRTGCNYYPSDPTSTPPIEGGSYYCYCGAIDLDDCMAQVEPPQGPCRNEIAAAVAASPGSVNPDDPSSFLPQFLYEQFPAAHALALEECAAESCRDAQGQCGEPVGAGGTSSGGATGNGGAAGGSGGKGGTSGAGGASNGGVSGAAGSAGTAGASAGGTTSGNGGTSAGGTISSGGTSSGGTTSGSGGTGAGGATSGNGGANAGGTTSGKGGTSAGGAAGAPTYCEGTHQVRVDASMCVSCEQSNCDPTAALGCAAYAAGSSDRSQCEDVLTCIRSTDCIVFGSTDCYCGNLDILTCKSVAVGDSTLGPCAARIAAAFTGFNSTSKQIVDHIGSGDTPGGVALALGQCDVDNCGDVVSDTTYMEACLPYCTP